MGTGWFDRALRDSRFRAHRHLPMTAGQHQKPKCIQYSLQGHTLRGSHGGFPAALLKDTGGGAERGSQGYYTDPSKFPSDPCSRAVRNLPFLRPAHGC